MKNNITKLLLSFLLVGLISCDDNEVNLFSDDDAFFAFEEELASISENSTEDLELSIYLSKSQAQGSVTVEVDTEGVFNPAVEGVDYELSTGKTVTFDGDYYQEIIVKVIDNDQRDKDKQFYVSMASNNINAGMGMTDGKQSRMLITIVDDEHPLAALFGQLTVNDTSMEPEEYSYSVTLTAHEEDETKAILTGIWGVPQPIELQFDLESNEVKIPANQTLYGVNVGVLLDFTIFCYINETFEKETYGTYDLEKGQIEFPNGYALVCSGPEGSQYVGSAWAWSVQSYCIMTK